VLDRSERQALGAGADRDRPSTPPADLATARWPQLDGGRPLVLVPVGSTEQHGPHLPMATDTMVAEAVARAVCAGLSRAGVAAVVAPAVAYGASGEHEDFPGTVSVGHDALRSLLIEAVRSASRWTAGAVFVNGHGGNVATLDEVVDVLRHEGRRVAWVACATPAGDAHAGRTETSLLLYLAPRAVAVDRAEPGAIAPVSVLMPRLRQEGVRAVSANGVLGDPAGASAVEGAGLFAALVERVLGDVRRFLGTDGSSSAPPTGGTGGR
jgi:mycofactocin system creatininase family protein